EVRLAFEVTEEWHDPPDGMVADPSPDAPTLGAHAVPLLAYDADSDRFCFPNSWGESWGKGGVGTISRSYVDRYIVDAWCHVGQGVFPPIKSRTGFISLLWKC